MAGKVILPSELIDVLRKQHAASDGVGWLTGVLRNSDLVIIGFVNAMGHENCAATDPASVDWTQEQEALRRMLPSGVLAVGVFVAGNGDLEDAATMVKKLLHQILMVVETQRVELGYSEFLPVGAVFSESDLLLFGGANWANLPYDITAGSCKSLLSEHRTLRCTATVDISIVWSPEGDESQKALQWDSAVKKGVCQVMDELCSPSTVLLAQSPDGSTSKANSMLLSSFTNGVCEALPTNACGTVQLSLLHNRSTADGHKHHGVSPQIIYRPLKPNLDCRLETVRANLDIVCYCNAWMHLTGVYQQVILAVKSQLEGIQGLIRHHVEQRQFQAFQFLADTAPHYISVIYPVDGESYASGDEDSLKQERVVLHRRLSLPENRPVFRVACALDSSGTKSKGIGPTRITNVHEGLPPSGISGGRLSIIGGLYEYCHYRQDKCDDTGWGCAYRSCQTVFSWFQLQHYTNMPIPSHRAIQQLLVDIGDKEPSFVGSREWIGSIEVGYILDEMLGVTSRVVSKNANEDVSGLARDLLNHFEIQGTPVSIGGGVLAYTLLGIHFNEQTGEVAYLILDPHYTGGDDLQKIQRSGFVSWKRGSDKAAAGGPLFVPNTFYNFLCPQRPAVV